MSLRLNALWRPVGRLLADLIQPERAVLLVPVVTEGDPTLLIPPQHTFRTRGGIDVVRLRGNDAGGTAPLGASDAATETIFLTLAEVPVGSRLITTQKTWQVVRTRRKGPRGLLTRLYCIPVPTALAEVES